ncbi:hypothetical protein NDU88_001871 [Pleurodeles waltl]|uniref:Uncharacterized protein n=1 Tax=Pleurodeles waltl TaxID=8319 RepID=A0AAV7R8H3_PLEWA|nr:hypothetical protein NDU88_001871 [Pleurodeles waltl]
MFKPSARGGLKEDPALDGEGVIGDCDPCLDSTSSSIISGLVSEVAMSFVTRNSSASWDRTRRPILRALCCSDMRHSHPVI